MAVIPDTHNTGLTPTQIDTAFSNALTHTPSDSTPKEDGSGSAGEAETFARSDHEHPHDTTKQDTLAFEGTYNASTNKAATMADIKDGKLTGYEEADSKQALAATDKVVEAFGKLEKRADLNENNILTVLDANGAKNQIFVDKLNRTNANGVIYTINNDGTITVNGTPSGTSPSYVVIAMPDGGTYKDFSQFCNGENVLSGCPSGGGTSTYRMYITGSGYTKEDFGDGVELTATAITPLYLIIYIYNGYTADNLIFKPMICDKSLWDVSQKYVPYAMDNVELTNNISLDFKRNNINLSTVNGGVNSGGAGFIIDTTAIDMPAGNYYFCWKNTSTTVSSVVNCYTADNTRVVNENKANNAVEERLITVPQDCAKFAIYCTGINTITDFMIVPESAFTTGMSYHNPTPSIAQLYQMILALQ